MPNINKIIEENYKKIDLEKYFGEEAFLHIKKMNKIESIKVQLLIGSLPENNLVKYMIKYAKENNLTLDEVKEKLSNEENQDMLFDIISNTKNDKSIEDMLKIQKEIYDLYIINCICEDKHNFVDNDNVLIDLSKPELFYKVFDDEIIEYIIDEIKKHNESKKKIYQKKKQKK